MKIEKLQNGIRLLRDDTAFPLSTDAILLADFARVTKGTAVCDLCAGGGAVGLLLLSRDPALEITALELQPEPCALMARAAAESGVQDRFHILQGDVRHIRTLLPAGAFRNVVCNPPYYPVGSGCAPENEAQEIARTERCCTPEDLSAAAAWLLPTGGNLWLVHRPERLTDLLCALRGKGLEPKRLRPACPRPAASPALILLQAVRGGRPGLKWEPPLVLAADDGTPTEEYRRIYRLK